MDRVIQLLETSAITDILFAGFVDDDSSPKRCRLLPECLFLGFSGRLLRCTSIGQFDQLALQVIDRAEPPASASAARILEDYEFCLVPVLEQFVTEGFSEYRVASLRCFLDERSDPERATVAAAAFLLESGDTLFLDPRNTFGVRLGGASALERWTRLSWEGGREFTWPKESG